MLIVRTSYATRPPNSALLASLVSPPRYHGTTVSFLNDGIAATCSFHHRHITPSNHGRTDGDDFAKHISNIPSNFVGASSEPDVDAA